MRLRIALTINLDRRPAAEPEPDRESTLDALVDRADPHGREVPVFGFQPRTAEEDT